jgi:diguanylate cyclase (GGDEF)-like protein
MFDIDHFKNYNDLHGHQEGNVVLQSVAGILRDTGRRGDIVARYGGEEFVALLYGASREEAERFAESARRGIERFNFPMGETQPLGRVTLSAGVATFPSDAAGDEALIRAADARLYRAKEGGRNRVVSTTEA